MKGKLLHPQSTLKKAFPAKADDDAWLSWKGPFFGIYSAPTFCDGQTEATISVGDEVVVTRRASGGEMLTGLSRNGVLMAVIVLLAAAWLSISGLV